MIQPPDGEGIPGEVNIDWYKTAVDSLQPDRFQNVRPLHEKCRHDDSPVLVAYDVHSKKDMMLQVFTSKPEYKRVKECCTRCFKLRGNAMSHPLSPGSVGSPASPKSMAMSPGSRGEPKLCKILEVHCDEEAQQWCVVIEPPSNDKSGSTLEAKMRTGPLEKGKIRQAFIRAARGVQSLHRAGLVHNAICPQNIIKCEDGLKLGNYAGLQRQGEERRSTGPGHSLFSPERALAEDQKHPLKCDFATDVWYLGLLLHELVSGVTWDAGRPRTEVVQELLSSDVVPLGALHSLGDEEEAVEVRSLVARMMAKHPMQRPVVDVIVQEAIAKLYVDHDLETDDCCSMPPSPVHSLKASPLKTGCGVGPVSRSPRGECNAIEESWGGVRGSDHSAAGNKVATHEEDSRRNSPATCACRCIIS